MAKRKARASAPQAPAGASPPPGALGVVGRTAVWLFAAMCAATLLAYAPALGGPYLFDDIDLPPFLESPPPLAVLVQRGARLLTNLSLLAEARLAGIDPRVFHFTNVFVHLLNGLLVWKILEQMLARLGTPGPGDRMAALAGAGLYLLHPLQTEAVAYISSRSEVLCALFAYLAFLVFLRTRQEEPIGWGRALAAVTLIGLSALSKEPGVAMAGVFVFYDLLTAPKLSFRPIVARWRLYVPLLAGAMAVGLKLYLTLSREGTAGVTGKHRPIDYLLTQFEVIWRYFRLILLPLGQNLDHGYAVTRLPGTLWTWLGFAALAALALLAWRMRARYPLAVFGLAFLLILLAPTSSLVPIDDTMAERRLYLGFPGIAMIAADLLRRIKPSWKPAVAMGAVLAVLAGLTARRAELYTSAERMWRDSVTANPRNGRAWFHLAFAVYAQGRCAEAVPLYEKAASAGPVDVRLLTDWATALACAGRMDEAIARLEEARRLQDHPLVWTLLGRMHAQKGDLDRALAELNEALRRKPDDATALVYRGNVHILRNEPAEALADYEQALRLAPGDPAALKGRQAALSALGRSR